MQGTALPLREPLCLSLSGPHHSRTIVQLVSDEGIFLNSKFLFLFLYWLFMIIKYLDVKEFGCQANLTLKSWLELPEERGVPLMSVWFQLMPGFDHEEFTSKPDLPFVGGLLHLSSVCAFALICSLWWEKNEKSNFPTEQGCSGVGMEKLLCTVILCDSAGWI